jgi:hypothetical protein
MKSISFKAFSFLLMLIFSVLNLPLLAQDNPATTDGGGKVSITTSETTTTSTDWYTQPWVWIVGAAVLIIVLVALLRGNSNDTREVSRTTVIKDRP